MMHETRTRKKLERYFGLKRSEILAKYEISELFSHMGLRGHSREVFTRAFLSENLPSITEYASGELIDSNDTSSGEVDIIVYSSYSSKMMLSADTHMILNDYALCGIEVKSKFNKSTVVDCCKKSLLIKKLKREVPVIAGSLESTPVIIVGFGGLRLQTVCNQIEDYYNQNGHSFDLMPDIIVNLTTNEVLIRNNGFLLNKDSRGNSYLYFASGECLIHFSTYIQKLATSLDLKSISSNTVLGKYLL